MKKLSTGTCTTVEYVIVDSNGVRIPNIAPFTDIVAALKKARALGTCNTVMKVAGTTQIPMAHQGPGGWCPKVKIKEHRGDPCSRAARARSRLRRRRRRWIC
jgi:hypothetical protein